MSNDDIHFNDCEIDENRAPANISKDNDDQNACKEGINCTNNYCW